ncbi:hypothetical protein FRB95_011660 [Tulasnella sp. JGI-2019a]|nr:hypothetical protein FRB95_011660 [Tulasnella sp. JGI-2019a]
MNPLAGGGSSHTPSALDQTHLSSSIRMLPTELLIQVLYWLLPREDESYWYLNDSPTEYFSALSIYMRVSKHWEMVIKNTEEFWTIVDCRFPDTLWKAALARSQVQPLAVLLSPHGTDLASHNLDHRDCVVQTFRHIHRWSAAELWLQRSEDVMLINKLEASTLLRLRIYFVDPTLGNRPHLQITRFKMPILQHLFLSYISLDSSHLSQLSSLASGCTTSISGSILIGPLQQSQVVLPISHQV